MSVLQQARTSEALRERSGRLSILTLIHMEPIPAVRHRTCQWITQPSRPPLFCADPVAAPGCSWCAAHLVVVFQQPQKEATWPKT